MSVKKSLPRGALARAEKVLAALQARYPRPATHLEADNAWELLVATVLAAQCTAARVNTVTPELFRRWPGPAELALATQEELESAYMAYRQKRRFVRLEDGTFLSGEALSQAAEAAQLLDGLDTTAEQAQALFRKTDVPWRILPPRCSI